MFSSNDEVLKYIKAKGIQFVDVRFCDLPGQMQHVTIPVENFDEGTLTAGVAFDGSSIRGFQQIHESDMVLLPDLETAFVDPFRVHPTLVMNWFVHDPVSLAAYSRDPRNVARKAEAYLTGTDMGDTAYFGQEAEFYIFDDVRFDVTANSAFHVVDSIEGAWNTGREEPGGNLGYKPKYKGGYYPVPPNDHYADLRDEMARVLIDSGMHIELHHHEVGTGGQSEIGVLFGTLLAQADKLMKFKYIVKGVARRAGKTVTFMPKPIFGDNGSGMHVHQSVWKSGTNLFWQDGSYADLSDTARHYIGGLLHHAPKLLAFTNPTMNSYHRLVPGFEAPTNLVFSQRNRSACIRVPITGKNPKAKRIEFRVPDPSCNPYLAFAAMLMAGLDGVRRKLEPMGPFDQDLYELDAEELSAIPQVPGSLEKVLDNLEDDHAFLVEGGVFTEDLIETWIAWKRENEIDPLRFRPHPYEFALSFDV